MDSIMSLLSFTALVSPLLIFLASCFYLSKSAKADSVLLFVGSGIAFLITVFFTLMPRFVQSRNLPLSELSLYYSIAGIISLVGGICFAVGFFLLVTDAITTHKQKSA